MRDRNNIVRSEKCGIPAALHPMITLWGHVERCHKIGYVHCQVPDRFENFDYQLEVLALCCCSNPASLKLSLGQISRILCFTRQTYEEVTIL